MVRPRLVADAQNNRVYYQLGSKKDPDERVLSRVIGGYRGDANKSHNHDSGVLLPLFENARARSQASGQPKAVRIGGFTASSATTFRHRFWRPATGASAAEDLLPVVPSNGYLSDSKQSKKRKVSAILDTSTLTNGATESSKENGEKKRKLKRSRTAQPIRQSMVVRLTETQRKARESPSGPPIASPAPRSPPRPAPPQAPFLTTSAPAPSAALTPARPPFQHLFPSLAFPSQLTAPPQAPVNFRTNPAARIRRCKVAFTAGARASTFSASPLPFTPSATIPTSSFPPFDIPFPSQPYSQSPFFPLPSPMPNFSPNPPLRLPSPAPTRFGPLGLPPGVVEQPHEPVEALFFPSPPADASLPASSSTSALPDPPPPTFPATHTSAASSRDATDSLKAPGGQTSG
ncbi:hypothetical protein JCM6882_007369 [Rhodosporidiobolus microsporus]